MRNLCSVTEQGVPVLSQFEDGRKGIFYKSTDRPFIDGEIDWAEKPRTISASFVTRCVVVRTQLDNYFAVGDESVVGLGKLNPQNASFSVLDEDEIKYLKYGRIMPDLTIGEPWLPTLKISGDDSKVSFAHVDLGRGMASKHPAIPTLGQDNYFDAARKVLELVEPGASDPIKT